MGRIGFSPALSLGGSGAALLLSSCGFSEDREAKSHSLSSSSAAGFDSLYPSPAGGGPRTQYHCHLQVCEDTASEGACSESTEHAMAGPCAFSAP